MYTTAKILELSRIHAPLSLSSSDPSGMLQEQGWDPLQWREKSLFQSPQGRVVLRAAAGWRCVPRRQQQHGTSPLFIVEPVKRGAMLLLLLFLRRIKAAHGALFDLPTGLNRRHTYICTYLFTFVLLLLFCHSRFYLQRALPVSPPLARCLLLMREAVCAGAPAPGAPSPPPCRLGAAPARPVLGSTPARCHGKTGSERREANGWKNTRKPCSPISHWCACVCVSEAALSALVALLASHTQLQPTFTCPQRLCFSFAPRSCRGPSSEAMPRCC